MVTETIVKLPLGYLQPNPYQPASRVNVAEEVAERFANSILEHGLLQIPICRKVSNNIYQMGDGWLRLLGFRWLMLHGKEGFSEIPVVVKELDDREMADLVMESNLVRQDLTPIELAGLYQKYLEDFNMTQAELAKLHHVSQGEIANTIRLLELPEDIQQQIISQEISETHGRTLLQLQDKPKEQSKMVQRIIKDNISVAQMDREIKQTIWHDSYPLHLGNYSYPENPLFNLAECQDCDHSVMLHKPWGDHEKLPRCNKPKCWKDKQATAFQRSRAVEVDELKKQGITEIFDNLDYDKYTSLVDETCNACEKRGVIPDYNKKLKIICLDCECAQGKRDKGGGAVKEELKQESESREKQIDAIFLPLAATPLDNLLNVSIECLLRNCAADLSYIKTSLKLAIEEEPDLDQVMAVVEGLKTEDRVLFLSRLCFEIFSVNSYEEEEEDYILKRFQGAQKFSAEPEEIGGNTEGEEAGDNPADE